MVTKKKTTKGQTMVRMDDELKARVRKYQQKLQKETHLQVSFATAVRALVEKGLEAS